MAHQLTAKRTQQIMREAARKGAAENARKVAAENARRPVTQDVTKGRIRIQEADRPALGVTAIVMGAPPTFTSDGFGGYESVDLVTGRPVGDYTEPAANRLAVTLMFDDVRRRRSVEDDCSRLERWASRPTVLRVAGLIPRRAGPMRFVIPRGGLTPSTDLKRVWWVYVKGAADYRIRQGYEVTLMEVGEEALIPERPTAKVKRKSARASTPGKSGNALADARSRAAAKRKS